MTTDVQVAPASSLPAEGGRAKRRRLRRLRRLLAALTLVAPTLSILAFDVARRARHIGTFDRLHLLGYMVSIVEDACLWAALLCVAAVRRGRLRQAAAGTFAVLFAFSTAVQGGFHALYGIYASIDPLVDEASLLHAVSADLPLSRPVVILYLILGVFMALSALVLARRFVRPRPGRRRRWIRPIAAVVMVGAAFNVPVSYRSIQSTSPDLIYLRGLARFVVERLRPIFQPDEARPLRGQ